MGGRRATRVSRSPCSPTRFITTRAATCRWSASPAPTARRRRPTCIAAIFEAARIRCGILGTVAYKIGGDLREATRTTPEAPEVQGLLRDMVDRRMRRLRRWRSRRTRCRCGGSTASRSPPPCSRTSRAIISTSTRTWRTYFQAKRRLFELLPRDAPSLINLDDPRGASLTELAGARSPTPSTGPADITPGPLSFSLEGLTFDVRTPRGPIRIRSSLVGRPNVYNIVAAVAAGTALGLPLDAIERGIAALPGVPGRFQVVSGAQDEVTVVVDYAHTDDALRNLLETARPLARGRLITVFGCGGDRDRTKRPLMGAVADRLSDVIVVTSDNPRTEDPARIIDEIRRGLSAGDASRQRSPAADDRRSGRGDRRGRSSWHVPAISC